MGMQITITRFEFAPFNIGFHLYQAKSKQMVLNTLNELGWINIAHQFDKEEYDNIVHQGLGVYQKNTSWLFVADTGFFVARYAFEVIHHQDAALLPTETITTNIAQSFLDRVQLHKSITLTGSHTACSDIEEFMRTLRQKQSKHTQKSLYHTNAQHLHAYSLSVYAITGNASAIYPTIKHALLFPRNIGCSSSIAECSMPTLDEIIIRLQDSQKLTVGDYKTIELRQKSVVMHASWSSVVVEESMPKQGVELVSLCEFWVQSIWSAAFHAAKTASTFNSHALTIKDYSQLNITQQTLKRLSNKHGLKLNPNSPPDPSAAIKIISITSDLTEELRNADEALEYAIAQANYVLNERNMMTRKLLETFSLIFASSSLAPLLLPTPLSTKTISEHPFMFLVWVGLTLVGIMLVAKQR